MEPAPKRLKVNIDLSSEVGRLYTAPKTFYQQELDRCDELFTNILYRQSVASPEFVHPIEDQHYDWYMDDRQTIKYELEDLEIDKQGHFSNVYIGQFESRNRLDPNDPYYSNLLEYKLNVEESGLYFNQGYLPSDVVRRILLYSMDNDSTSAYALLSVCRMYWDFRVSNAKMFAPMIAPKMLFGPQERAASWLYDFLSTPFDFAKAYSKGPHNALELRRFESLGLESQRLLETTIKTARKTCVFEALTGTGKTVTVLNAIERYKPGKKKVLIICPPIISSNVYMQEFRKFFNNPNRMINMFGTFSLNYKTAEYIIVSFNFINDEVITNALLDIGYFDVVVVDEFHSKYQHNLVGFITDTLQVDNIILMSATPPKSEFVNTNTYIHVKTTPERRMAAFFGFTYCPEVGLNLIDNNKSNIWYIMKSDGIPKPLFNYQRYMWKMLNPLKIQWKNYLENPGSDVLYAHSELIHFNPEYGFGKALIEVITERKRLIVFAQHQEILDRVYGFLQYYNTDAAIFDLRKSTRGNYTKFSKNFNKCKKEKIIVVASTNVAGVGINFHTKNISTIVFLEMNYSEHSYTIKQCEGRIVRVGQASNCHYYYFTNDDQRSGVLLHQALERYFEHRCASGFLSSDQFTTQLYRYCIASKLRDSAPRVLAGVKPLNNTLKSIMYLLKTFSRFNCYLPVYILMLGSTYFADFKVEVYVDYSGDSCYGVECTLEEFILAEITKATMIDPSITDRVIELADRYLPTSRAYILKNKLKPQQIEPIDYGYFDSMF